MCRENPNLKFLVIVYNKSTQQHAHKVFPKNAKCKTAHSIALDGLKNRYRLVFFEKNKTDKFLKNANMYSGLQRNSSFGHIFN